MALGNSGLSEGAITPMKAIATRIEAATASGWKGHPPAVSAVSAAPSATSAAWSATRAGGSAASARASARAEPSAARTRP